MTDETPDNLDKEVEQRSENFREIWERTPEINRFVFNDKLEKIRHSCSIIESRIQISKELKILEKSLRKTRDRNFIFSFVILLIFFVYENTTFIQSESYKLIQNSDKTIIFSIILLFVTSFIIFSENSKWIDYISQKNKLDIIKSFPTYTDSRSRFYKYFIIQENEPYNESNSKKYHLDYLSESINLLSKVNSDSDNSNVEF